MSQGCESIKKYLGKVSELSESIKKYLGKVSELSESMKIYIGYSFFTFHFSFIYVYLRPFAPIRAHLRNLRSDICHSERSEESLFLFPAGFLTVFGMTKAVICAHSRHSHSDNPTPHKKGRTDGSPLHGIPNAVCRWLTAVTAPQGRINSAQYVAKRWGKKNTHSCGGL